MVKDVPSGADIEKNGKVTRRTKRHAGLFTHGHTDAGKTRDNDQTEKQVG